MHFTGPAPVTIDLRKYIDTAFYGERPHIRGRRLPVTTVAANWEQRHLSVAELAHEFSLSEEEVLAALLYYRENQAELDAQDVQEQALFDQQFQRGDHN